MNYSKRNRWLSLVPAIVLLISWEVVANATERGVFFFGSPSSIASMLYNKTIDGSLWWDTGITLYEVVVGFIIGNIIGCLFGLSFWYNSKVADFVRPYIVIIGAVPVIALAPLVIMFFGIGIWSKIVLVIFSTFALATVQAFEGARRTSPLHVRYLLSLGADRWQVFSKLVIPSSLTWVFTGLKLNVGLAISGAFLGEFIAAEGGLGHLIIEAMGLFNMPLVLAGVSMIALMAYVLNKLISFLQRILLPWENDI